MPRLTMQAAGEDRTERALFDAFLVANDFRDALNEAQSSARAIQIKERVAAILADLTQVENEALQRANALSVWGN